MSVGNYHFYHCVSGPLSEMRNMLFSLLSFFTHGLNMEGEGLSLEKCCRGDLKEEVEEEHG